MWYVLLSKSTIMIVLSILQKQVNILKAICFYLPVLLEVLKSILRNFGFLLAQNPALTVTGSYFDPSFL